MTRLVFAPIVRLELIEIGDAIASDNRTRARTFVEELEAKARRIAATPQIYRLREDIAEGVRLAPHDSYVILFSYDGNRVEILHIVHGARDLKMLFEH